MMIMRLLMELFAMALLLLVLMVHSVEADFATSKLQIHVRVSFVTIQK
jgi:hypothetical protein